MTTNNTLIIFDWDDTLFPTSWLIKNGIKLNILTDVKKYKLYFNELDIVLHNLLHKSISLGKVIIVTNAMKEWVMMSKSILPKTSQLIDNNIEVISAREIFNKKYSMEEWKKNVFHHIITRYVMWANQIISFGDAMYEYNAIVSLNNVIKKNTYLKIVKLMASPNFDDLIDQLNVMSKSINDIYKTKNHLDLRFDKMFENNQL
jgi:hypothetical protein